MTPDEIIEMAMKSGCPRENAFVNFDILQDFAKLVADKATAAEREACARLCESMPYRAASAGKAADAIRARGQR